MTLKNNRAPIQCYAKHYASFRSHWWIQTGITVRKRPIWVKIDDYFSRVILKFDIWPWKTMGHLFYSTSSVVRNFVAIGGLELELQSKNAQFRVTLKCDGWSWKTTGHLFNSTSSFVHHFVVIGGFKLELRSGNVQSGSNSVMFRAVWPWNLTDDLEKQ